MGKIILCLVATCVIPLFSYGKHNSTGDSRNMTTARRHELNIQNIRTLTTRFDTDRGLSIHGSSKQKDSYMNPITNATSLNKTENIIPPGLLQLFKSSTQQDIEGKDPIHANENTTKDERFKTKNITSSQYKQSHNTSIGEEISAAGRLAINKRFNGDFRNYFENKFQKWFYRRYGYFDLLASSILRK